MDNSPEVITIGKMCHDLLTFIAETSKVRQ